MSHPAKWLLLVGLTGCLEAEVLHEVALSGAVHSDQAGPVELWFMHSRWGDGDLETSNMVFDSNWLDDAGEFTCVVQVPQTAGEGLSVYGWQDVDGDGEHCRPGSAPEPSGIVEGLAYPTHELEIELELVWTCEGPDGP